MNWLDIEIDEKVYKRILIIGILIIFAYVIVFAISFLVPRVYTLDSKTIIDEENCIKNGISKLNVGDKIIELEGWAYKEEQSIETYDCYFVLKGYNNDKMYILRTIKKEVEPLMFVDNQYNCYNSGLYSKSLIAGLEKGVYDLYILYKNNGENILTNTTLRFEI